MQQFKYFSIYHNSETDVTKFMEDTVIDEDKVLSMCYRFPHMRTMQVNVMFLALLAKWNTEQTHPTIRYFYGPL